MAVTTKTMPTRPLTYKQQLPTYNQQPTTHNKETALGTNTMKRATFTITQQQLDWLEQESEKTGLNKVEIVRRALDDYKDVQAEKEQCEYFTPQQQHNIKIMAQMQRISETEVIRKAIDRETRVVSKLKRTQS